MFLAAPKMVSFGAARKDFGPFYFVTALANTAMLNTVENGTSREILR